MKKLLLVVLILVLSCVVLFAKGSSEKASSNKITIWTSGEDYRNAFYLKSLQEKFPQYDFILEYMNTSTIAAKIMEEKDKTSVDIVLSEEYGYLHMIEPHLATLNDFDFSQFLDEIVPASHKYTPEVKNGGAIIINTKLLKSKGLPIPTSYADLLNPAYKNLVSMPNPASSGSGYMFLRQLTNEWGEDAAFAYFEKLTDNILQYTSSGSGPVNALVQGEVAIGLGMTSQAVTEINQGVDLEIVFFKEGSPYSMYGNAVLAKSVNKNGVMEVFNYLATELAKQNNELFFPDQVFKNFKPTIEGFPTDIPYGNMSNDTLEEKQRLLGKWDFS